MRFFTYDTVSSTFRLFLLLGASFSKSMFIVVLAFHVTFTEFSKTTINVQRRFRQRHSPINSLPNHRGSQTKLPMTSIRYISDEKISPSIIFLILFFVLVNNKKKNLHGSQHHVNALHT